MIEINAVILAGGKGMRLWPLSRHSYPKQFSNIFGKHSLFQECALRVLSSPKINFSKPVIVTQNEFRFIVSEQLQSIGIDPGAIIIEPEAKNTAPAALATTFYIAAQNPNAIMLLLPSDHLIPDTKYFHYTLLEASKYLEKGKIITFGIKPTAPETAYGYLEINKTNKDDICTVNKFVEKPNYQDAKHMLDNKNFLWNSGIFLFRALDIIDAYKKYYPEIVGPIKESVIRGASDLGFWRLNADQWKKCESISIDYAVMEKADNLLAVPFNSEWSDLGSWNAVWQKLEKSDDGVVTSGQATSIECSDSLLFSETKTQHLVGLGLKNIVAVSMPDAVLVIDKNKSQQVRQVVEALKAKSVAQAENYPKDYRPWGSFETLILGDNYRVKLIEVSVGGVLSLQSHEYRSEHWVVVEGLAKVTVDSKEILMNEGQSIYIPVGSKHRLENNGSHRLLVIETQIGSYLEEDDIKRYEDIYDRT